MTSAESVVDSILEKRSAVLRYGFLVTLAAGIFLCGLGYFIGQTHLRLILKGVRTQGTIVNYHQQVFTSRRSNGITSSSMGYMPIVEYRASGGQKVRFQDWLGSKTAGTRGQVVDILYNSANPTVAMIDRPIWNWIPWAPTIAVGLLLVLSGVRRGIRSYSCFRAEARVLQP